MSTQHKPAGTFLQSKSVSFQEQSNSATMRDMLWNAEQIAGTDLQVLIAGEAGTGKQWLARQIHLVSGRSEFPLIEFPCDVIRSYRLESELLGSRRRSGAALKEGILARTQSGTLVLHHVSQLPLDFQPKLVRIMETRQYVARTTGLIRRFTGRVIGTIIGNPHALFEGDRMGQDLYRFFGAVVLTIPPLRDRREDLELLIERFIHESNNILGTRVKGIDKRALQICARYSWPANIRELRNAIRYATLLSKDDIIQETDLPPYIREEVQHGRSASKPGKRGNNEEHLLQRALCRAPTIKEAARLLGMSLKALCDKIAQYGLPSNLVNPTGRRKLAGGP